jgi:nitrite reductase/ring-hydroxylating ferredoxin subunit
MFDMKSGTCLMPSRGGPVTSYPVTIEAGEVWVEVP